MITESRLPLCGSLEGPQILLLGRKGRSSPERLGVKLTDSDDCAAVDADTRGVEVLILKTRRLRNDKRREEAERPSRFSSQGI